MIWKPACLVLIPLYGSLATVGGVEATAKSKNKGAAVYIIPQSKVVVSRLPPESLSERIAKTELQAWANTTQNTRTRKTISQILTDKSLWGKDFPSVLAHLQSFRQAGENQIAVFADKVVTTTPLKSEAEARRIAEKLQQAISETNAKPNALTQRLLSLDQGQRKSLKAEVLSYFGDDESVRVKVNSLICSRKNYRWLRSKTTWSTGKSLDCGDPDRR